MGMTWDSKCHGGSEERESVLMVEFWGSWGWPPRADGIWVGLERLNGFSLHEVKEEMRVRTCPKVGYMLRNTVCQEGGLKCGRRDCQAILTADSFGAGNCKKEAGRVWRHLWTWQVAWPVEGDLLRCLSETVVAIQLRWWRPGSRLVAEKREEAAMCERRSE